jgi:hypothetical protein
VGELGRHLEWTDYASIGGIPIDPDKSPFPVPVTK